MDEQKVSIAARRLLEMGKGAPPEELEKGWDALLVALAGDDAKHPPCDGRLLHPGQPDRSCLLLRGHDGLCSFYGDHS